MIVVESKVGMLHDVTGCLPQIFSQQIKYFRTDDVDKWLQVEVRRMHC